ncbi:MAG: TonB C-terminal domain-containing protein [Bdellovibrionales bacterium]|nr:TonB C-terminal domain-containing protein [Bdellovibrionales bacterium]
MGLWIFQSSQKSEKSQPQIIDVVYNSNNKAKEDLNRTIKEMHAKELDDQLSQLEKQVSALSEKRKRYKEQTVSKNLNSSSNQSNLKHLSPIKKKEQSSQASRTKIKNSEGDVFLVAPSEKSLSQPYLINPKLSSPAFLKDIPSIKAGKMTLLNTDQFTYYAFFYRLNHNFSNRWVSNVVAFNEGLNIFERNELARSKKITRIEAILDPKGELLEVYLHQSSGVKALDQAVLKAISDTAPVKNPPEGLVEDDGLIHLHYSLEVQWQKHYAAQSPVY